MPVKQLINDIEKSVAENGYDRLRIETDNNEYFCSPNEITYTSKYFFTIKAGEGIPSRKNRGEVLVNINHLKAVELFMR